MRDLIVHRIVAGGAGMSYSVHYGPEDRDKYPQTIRMKSSQRMKIVVAVAVTGALLWVKFLGVPDVLIPGEPEVTKAAVVEMIQTLREGEALKSAVTAFCKNILNGEVS